MSGFGSFFAKHSRAMLTRVWRFGPAVPRLLRQTQARYVSQSKPSGAGSTAVTELHAPVTGSEGAEVSPFVKNPDYHGFSSDPEVDEWNMRIGFFFGISLCIVVGGTYIHYLPDPGMRQWARREAERLIVQRERDGLPLIGENYYDPSKIILPSKEQE